MNPAADDDYTPHYAEPPCTTAALVGSDKRIHRILSLQINESTRSDPPTRDLIISEQNKDPIIKEIKQLIATNADQALIRYANTLTKRQISINTIKSLKIVDGILVRTITTKEYGLIDQILVPNKAVTLHDKLLQNHHNEATAGHFGKTRTFARLMQNYYWQSMRKDTNRFCKACIVCQHARAIKPLKYQSELLPSLPTKVNGRIAIDLITDYAPTQRGNKHILSIVDYFTKYALAIALPNKEAKTVADALWTHWFMHFGIPMEIQSDQGTEFTNDYLQRICEQLRIDHQISAPFKPSSQGIVERFNRTLKSILTAFIKDQSGSWDHHLPTATFAYNTSVSPVTGFTPFFLMYGRQARLPSSLLTGDYNEQFHDFRQYGSLLTTHLRSAHDIVRERLAEYAIEMKSRWDSKVKDFQPFKKGDVVKMYNPQLATKNGELPNSHKLKSKWQGPYTVIDTAVHGNDAIYVLKDPTTLREWTVNVELLEEYHGDDFLKSNKRKTSQSPTNSPTPSTTQMMVSRDGNDQSDQPGFEENGTQTEPISLRTVHTAVNTSTANQSIPPPTDLRGTEAEESTSIGSRPQRKAARQGQVKRRSSEDASSGQLGNESDEDQIPSFKKLRFDVDKPTHPSHSRHTTGLTKKERQRKHERDHRNRMYVTSAEALKEYDLDEILSHHKKDNQYRYHVSWQDKTIPNRDLSRKDFVTDEILWDYWNNSKFRTKDKPQEFRKASRKSNNT